MIDRDTDSLPAAVQVTANTHIAMLEALLPGWLEGWYAVGSVALGAFQPGFSDIDFVATVRRGLDGDELGKLMRLHRGIADKRLFTPLDGYYVPPGGFGPGAGQACLRFNEGKYCGPAAFRGSSPDGWVLKRRGVRLLGEGPEQLPFVADWALIAGGMLQNLDTYWRRWLDGCRRLSPRALGLYFRPDVLEWGVLGVTRIYYSLREGDVTSKAGAGEYALRTVPGRWRPVLMEALRRRDPAILAQFASPLRRRREALDYMEFIIGECGRTSGSNTD